MRILTLVMMLFVGAGCASTDGSERRQHTDLSPGEDGAAAANDEKSKASPDVTSGETDEPDELQRGEADDSNGSAAPSMECNEDELNELIELADSSGGCPKHLSLVAVGIQLACGIEDAVGVVYEGAPFSGPPRGLSLSIWISENPELWERGCSGGMDAFHAFNADECRPTEESIEQLYSDCGLERFGFQIGAWQALEPVDAASATVLAGMIEAADPDIRTRLLELLFFSP